MKNLIVLALFMFSFSFAFANGNPSNQSPINDSENPPVKKSKLNKKANCFTLCNPYKLNTICRMIQTGNYEAVLGLISKGADINKESVKLTPLMYAARYNKAEIVRLLIANGADIHKRSSQKGYTALKWAKLSNAKEAHDAILVAIAAESGIR